MLIAGLSLTACGVTQYSKGDGRQPTQESKPSNDSLEGRIMAACRPGGVAQIATDFGYNSRDVIVVCSDGSVRKVNYS